MAAVRSGHGRCADLESRLLSGERWIYVDQQSLLKIGRSWGGNSSNLCSHPVLATVAMTSQSASGNNHRRPSRMEFASSGSFGDTLDA
jgi:hypothetical protein